MGWIRAKMAAGERKAAEDRKQHDEIADNNKHGDDFRYKKIDGRVGV